MGVINSARLRESLRHIRDVLICRIRGHEWRFVIRSLEGHKIFECKRCGQEFVAY